MKISWLGQACFKIQTKTISLVIDPYDPKIGLKSAATKADLVLSTHDHHDHNYLEAVTAENPELAAPYVIKNPGEYEVSEIMVHGIQAAHDKKGGAERGLVTMYSIQSEGINILHVGDLGEKLTNEQVEAIGNVDILLIPVGGTYTIDGKEASDIVSQLEPRVVIPMHYLVPGLTVEGIAPVDLFLKEMGAVGVAAQESYKITKKELPQEETQVVILEPLKAK